MFERVNILWRVRYWLKCAWYECVVTLCGSDGAIMMLKYVDNFYLPFEKLTQYNKRTHILNTHSGSWSPPGFLSDGKEAVHFDLLGVKSACEQEEKGFNRVSCSVGQVSSPHKMSLHLFKFLVTKCGTLWSFEATETTQNVKHRAPNFVSLLSKFYIHCFIEQ